MNPIPTILNTENQESKEDAVVALSEFELDLIAGGTGIVNTI